MMFSMGSPGRRVLEVRGFTICSFIRIFLKSSSV